MGTEYYVQFDGGKSGQDCVCVQTQGRGPPFMIFVEFARGEQSQLHTFVWSWTGKSYLSFGKILQVPCYEQKIGLFSLSLIFVFPDIQ